MSGYSIGLYRYMRVDENIEKQKRLLESAPLIIGEDKSEPEEIERNKKFLCFGEFDRICFERIERFKKYRDIPKSGRAWIGDRQMHLVYSICRDESENDVYYQDGHFFENRKDGAVQTDRLFIGLTILQFRFSVRKGCQNVTDFLEICRKNILKLVEDSKKNVKCTVMGTLGSFGLTIIWLSDQYKDVLHLVTKIKNTNVGSEKREEKSIFLSAYTIFAKNHRFGNDWDKKIENIEGSAILSITLKGGLKDGCMKELLKLAEKTDNHKLMHCTGEHDVIFQMKSSKAFQIFARNNKLHFKEKFYVDNFLQTNVNFCEVIQASQMENLENAAGSNASIESEYQKNPGLAGCRQNDNTEDDAGKEKAELPELGETINKYKELRIKFGQIFRSTTGMIDTLDMLFSDYISKISIASNEMWADTFSHQFLRVLSCIEEIYGKWDKGSLQNGERMESINDLLSDFAKQVSYVAESNNLVLGTPICQYQYLGQNNLTLYAYLGIMKNVLDYVYSRQEISKQDEIIPIIVAEIIPIIGSSMHIGNEKTKEDSKIITVNMPMASLYNAACYYPYLYHEIFHYVVPKDRYVRNRLTGSMISMEILYNITKEMVINMLQKTENEQIGDSLFYLMEECFMPFIYDFMLLKFDKYINDIIIEQKLEGRTYREIDSLENCLISREYERNLFQRWIGCLQNSSNPELKNNIVYMYLEYLYDNIEVFKEYLQAWYTKNANELQAEDIRNTVTGFVKRLYGIVRNSRSDAAEESFQRLLSGLSEHVLLDASVFAESLRELVPDLAMASLCRLDFSEYLLLFTKIQCDMAIQQSDEIQDIIRIGMIVDYFSANNSDDSMLFNQLDAERRKYKYLYCGLFYSGSEKEGEGYIQDLSDRADKWFDYWKNCYLQYVKRYNIYASLLRRLQQEALVSWDSVLKNGIGRESSYYWKNYAQVLHDYGYYILEKKTQKTDDEWKKLRASIDKRIFIINIDLIHDFQIQLGFREINQKREDEWKNENEKMYQNSFNFEFYKRPMHTAQKKEKRTEIRWEYDVQRTGQAADLITVIADQLRFANERILGKGEHPIWYRGHEREEYQLIPSIMRKYKDKKIELSNADNFYIDTFLKQEYEEFKFRTDGSAEAMERTAYTEADYIALMQHYCTPTHFLDWTEDALSALYFALEGFLDVKVPEKKGNAALYIFSPELYNYARCKMLYAKRNISDNKTSIEEAVVKNTCISNIPNITVSYNREPFFMFLLGKKNFGTAGSYDEGSKQKEKWKYYMPMAVYVSRLNERIRAQSGIFLAYNIYTGPDIRNEFHYIDLEKIQTEYLKQYYGDEDTHPFLYKVIIKEAYRKDIAKWVKTFGMTKEKCYPELSNIGERIMR